MTEFKGGRVEYRTDKVGNIHIRVGKASFTNEQLLANVQAVIDELVRAKPAAAKGRYLLAVTLVVDHGPGRQHRPGPGPGGRGGAGRHGLTPEPVRPHSVRCPPDSAGTAVD